MRIRSRVLPVTTLYARILAGWTDTGYYMSLGTSHPERFAALLSRKAMTAIKTVAVGSETIEDVARGKSTKNPCYHTRVSYQSVPYSWCGQSYGAGLKYYFILGGVYKVPQSVSFPQVPTLSSYDNVLLSMEGVAALTPQFTPDIAGANSLWELKDFKGLFKLLYNDGEGIAQVAKAAREVYLNRDHIAENVANANLTIGLAVKPLVGDVCSIHKLLSRANGAIADFNKRGGVPNTFHFTKEVVKGEQKLSTINVGSTVMNRYQKQFVVYRASVRVEYEHVTDGKIDTFLQQWGLNLSPATIWNMLPFSFVVDYFASIGKSLESISRNGGTKWRWKDYIESWEAVSEVVYTIAPTQSYGESTTLRFATTDGNLSHSCTMAGDEVVVAVARRKTYTRLAPRAFPSGPTLVLPRIKWPSARQNGILGSLAISLTSLKNQDSYAYFKNIKGAYLGKWYK